MTGKIKYKLAEPSDYTDILKLYNHSYRSERSISDLEWLYLKNPMGRGALFIATIENDVVGMQGIVRYQFRQGHKMIDTYKSEDSLIHATYRGKGVYKTLYQMVFDYIEEDLIWGLTDKKTILERTGLPSKYRFELAATIHGFVSLSSFNGEQKKLAKMLLYNWVSLSSLFRKRKSKIVSKLYNKVLEDYTHVEAFAIKLSLQYPNAMMPLLSEEILKWRLLDNPKVNNYRVLALLDDAENIEALTLVTIRGKKSRWLASYFSKDLDSKHKKHHISAVKSSLHSDGINIIEQWIFNTNPLSTEAANLMYETGFRKIKNGLWIINNGHRVHKEIDQILFSAQLGLD